MERAACRRHAIMVGSWIMIFGGVFWWGFVVGVVVVVVVVVIELP